MYFGKRSDGDMLVNIKAKTIKTISNVERFHGTAVYQIATPINAMILGTGLATRAEQYDKHQHRGQ